MIGGIVGKLLDTSAAKHDAETWERHYREALQNWADEKGNVKRLTAELFEAKRQVADLQARAGESGDAHVLRLSADLTYARALADRTRKEHRAEVEALVAERGEALTARDVALRALEVSRVPAAGGLGSRDRENAQRLSEINERQRAAIEAFEADIAELRARLEKCGREH